MTDFVDLHCHVLPGIDDGPADLEGALSMARVAWEAGTSTIVATPHLRSDFPAVRVEEIAGRCSRLSAELSSSGIGVRIVPGAETSLVWALQADKAQLSAASYGGDGNDLLLETPEDVSMLDQLIYEVRRQGFRVILAHPERSRTFQREPGRLQNLADQGVLLQINADALLGKPGGPTRQLAEHLCRHGLAHVIASDGHRATAWRPVGSLALGVEAASRLVGHARASWMASAAPAAVVAGRELPRPPEVEVVRRPFWRLGRK
jgi:protein-tyrosine phosphatase